MNNRYSGISKSLCTEWCIVTAPFSMFILDREKAMYFIVPRLVFLLFMRGSVRYCVTSQWLGIFKGYNVLIGLNNYNKNHVKSEELQIKQGECSVLLD